jgi:probable HAF family extracellular repeat protein
MKSNTLVLAVSALLAAAPLAVAQKAAAPVDMGTLGGSASVANGIGANSDIVVGGANVFTDAYQHAFYTNSLGYLEDIESLIGVYGNAYASGVGAKGAVTGTSDQIIDSYGDTASHGFYFQSSHTGMVDLGTNGGTLGQGNATAGGIVVGAATVDGDVAYTAFYWTPKKGIVNLNTLDNDQGLNGYNSFALAMNSKQAAVGSSDSPDGNTHAVLWDLKTKAITDLSYLGAPYEGGYAQAMAINNSGTIVGFSTLPGDGQFDAFVGTVSGGLTDIGNLGGSYAQANSINDSGTVVGSSNITGDTDVHAFVWTQDGGMVDLNSLPGLSGSAFIELNSANGISADGTIVGVGTALDGQFHAFVW